jgi:hypothetical protein
MMTNGTTFDFAYLMILLHQHVIQAFTEPHLPTRRA